MPQSGKVSATVHELLRLYKQRCTAERNRPRHSSESPPALLPVSFSQAKDWLLRQQKALSAALESGAVSESAREVVAELSRSLAEQPSATAALLEQPARPASPALLPPVMSVGPEPVTVQVRAEERQVLKKAGELVAASGKQKGRTQSKPQKKKKTVSPEMAERQQRASAQMQELGVQPVQVRILFICMP